MGDIRYPVESAEDVAAAQAYVSGHPQFTATQRMWFTPRDLRRAASKGGITIKAEATGDMLWLVWEYGVPEEVSHD